MASPCTQASADASKSPMNPCRLGFEEAQGYIYLMLLPLVALWRWRRRSLEDAAIAAAPPKGATLIAEKTDAAD